MSDVATFTKAVADTLRTELGSAAREVRIHDGAFGGDGKEFTTLGVPGVLVACLGYQHTPADYEPPIAACQMVAFCVATVPANNVESTTRGQVAAKLASVVSSLVSAQRWDDEARGQAERIRATNHHSNAIAQKGVAVWSVSWVQEIELTSQAIGGTLNHLKQLNITYSMGDEDVEDVSSTLEF